MTADPLAGAVGNPQSLNRYSYVANNPANATDPLGLVVGINNLRLEGGGGFCPACLYLSSLAQGGIQFGSNFNEFDVLHRVLFPANSQIVTRNGQSYLEVGSGGAAGTFINPLTGEPVSGLIASEGLIPLAEFLQYSNFFWELLFNAQTPGAGLGPAGRSVAVGSGPQGPTQPPPKPQSQKKPPADCVANAAVGLAKAAHGAEVALTAFLAAGAHLFAAGALVAGGCFEPTPFEPLTCAASGFGALSTGAGAGVLSAFGAHELTGEVVPGLEQAVTCGSAGSKP